MGIPYAEVIGDPIAHSKSPLIHKFWLEKLGIEGDYRAKQVSSGKLEAHLATRRADDDWRGCNVAMPHKESIIPLLDTITRNAAAIGSVNTIRRDENGLLHGRNTDLHGIWRSLDAVAVEDKTVVLVGAGGAARAAAYALARYPARNVIILNRSLERGQRLLDDFRLLGVAKPLGEVPPTDLLINASPLGMAGYEMFDPDLSGLPRNGLIFDMVYVPLQTCLLRRARERGLNTVDGITMLIHQASESFSVFYKIARPMAFDSELRELLAQ